MKKVYLVIRGTIPGVYQECNDYQKAIQGFSGILCKGFNKLSDALLWWEANDTEKILKEDDIRMAFGEVPLPAEKRTPLFIYTDASINGLYGGWAGLVINNGVKRIRISGKKRSSDSQYMELYAIYKTVKQAEKEQYNLNNAIVYCDLQYISDTWKKNCCPKDRYKKLWKKLWKLLVKYNMEICWVKGHSNDLYNKECDRMAKLAVSQN